MLIDLNFSEIHDILVALKQRQAHCRSLADDAAGSSIDFDVSDPRRMTYNDRFVAYSKKADDLLAIIKKLENS